MAGLTRKELKQDEFHDIYEEFFEYLKQHYQEIAAAIAVVLVVVAAVSGWRLYNQKQESAANAMLGAAFKTFHAYVGTASADALGPDATTYTTAQLKYKKALDQFNQVIKQYPRQKAADIARYHAGICLAELGKHDNATQTLRVAAETSDRDLKSLAELALAQELAAQGKADESAKIAQQLVDRPTTTVPKSTALLALAEAYRSTQPAKARQIYEQMQKEYGSISYLSTTLKQDLEDLPK